MRSEHACVRCCHRRLYSSTFHSTYQQPFQERQVTALRHVCKADVYVCTLQLAVTVLSNVVVVSVRVSQGILRGKSRVWPGIFKRLIMYDRSPFTFPRNQHKTGSYMYWAAIR